MLKIIICGAGGAMGKAVADIAAQQGDIQIVAGIDAFSAPSGVSFPLYKNFSECGAACDVVIDFSSPKALNDISGYLGRTGCAAVLAATGYSADEIADIEKLSLSRAIFRSANLSMGVNLILNLCKKAAAFLGEGYDIEIVEKHHNKKVDAPSGTALLLADGITAATGRQKDYVFGRSGNDSMRKSGEIGIHAIRGGSIAGEHEVSFIGSSETVTISHSAANKGVFAVGALRAARFIKDKPAGLYNMDDLIGSL